MLSLQCGAGAGLSRQRTGPAVGTGSTDRDLLAPGPSPVGWGDSPLLSRPHSWPGGAADAAHLAVDTVPSVSTDHRVDTQNGRQGVPASAPGPSVTRATASQLRFAGRCRTGACWAPGEAGSVVQPQAQGPGQQTRDPGTTTRCCHLGVKTCRGALATHPF